MGGTGVWCCMHVITKYSLGPVPIYHFKVHDGVPSCLGPVLVLGCSSSISSPEGSHPPSKLWGLLLICILQIILLLHDNTFVHDCHMLLYGFVFI